MASDVLVFTDLTVPTDPGVYHRLLCMTGENKGTSYILTGQRAVAGRGRSADIPILDTKASRDHFELVLLKDKYILTDMKSQNGTLVNDLKVTQHKLSGGDNIIIGKTIYKYSLLTVLEPEKELTVTGDSEGEIDEYEDEEQKPILQKGKKNKKFLIYGVVGIVLLALLMGDGDDKKKKKKRYSSSHFILDEDESLVKKLRSRESEKEAKLEEEVQVYIHRGLRELREKNFYRALHEFEQALVKYPNHYRAGFYKKKTQDALDADIEKLFEKAGRDRESLKIMQAKSAYCAIIRLIDKNPNDERYIAAQKNLRVLEHQLGKEENEFKCY